MKHEFEKIIDGIYRLCIPFDGNIYTTVFALLCEQGSIIVDSGSNEFDAINYVIPAIKNLGVNPDWFICTHLHGDHYGGLKTLLMEFPRANVGGYFKKEFGNEKGTNIFIEDEELFGRFKILKLKGHSDDGLAIFDKNTEFFISGDGLQQYGLTRFGTSISNLEEYKASVAKVRKLNPKAVVASHEYEPFGYCVKGTKDINQMLLKCEEAIKKLEAFVRANETYDSDLLARAYREQYPKLPKVPQNTFEAIINFRRGNHESNFS